MHVLHTPALAVQGSACCLSVCLSLIGNRKSLPIAKGHRKNAQNSPDQSQSPNLSLDIFRGPQAEKIKRTQLPPSPPGKANKMLPKNRFSKPTFGHRIILCNGLSGPTATVTLSRYAVALHSVALRFPAFGRVSQENRATPCWKGPVAPIFFSS